MPHRATLRQYGALYDEQNFNTRGIEEAVRALANSFSRLPVMKRFLEGLTDSAGSLPCFAKNHVARSFVAVTPCNINDHLFPFLAALGAVFVRAFDSLPGFQSQILSLKAATTVYQLPLG
jgi:hypothetical protein